MHRFLITAVMCIAGLWAMQPAMVSACPMCKVANEDAPAVDADGMPIDVNARPRAYMYSILFMLSMPAMLLSSFGVAFYRMTRREADAAAVQSQSDVLFPSSVLPAKG